MANTRGPAKTPTFTKSQIAQAVKADDTKRRERAAAKRAAKRAAADAEAQAVRDVQAAREAEAVASRDTQSEYQAHLATLRVDFDALGGQEALGQSFEQYAAEQMEVAPEPTEGAKPKRERHYFGSMYALVAASKTYVKASNGILCNGDSLAMECGKYTRPVVVEGLKNALIAAKVLEGNPYLHLNPGQQSMNMRNKARAALMNGTVTMAAIAAHLKAASDAQPK